MGRRRDRGGGRKRRARGTEPPTAESVPPGLPDVPAAFNAVRKLSGPSKQSRRTRKSRSSDQLPVVTGTYVSESDEHTVVDSPPALDDDDDRTPSSYAPASEPDIDDLRHRALSGEIYREVSDFKVNTLMWVVGIVAATILAMTGLTLTLNQSLRDDVLRLLSGLRQDVRTETDRLQRDIDELGQRLPDRPPTTPRDTVG